jgi:general secretion pathway protein C
MINWIINIILAAMIGHTAMQLFLLYHNTPVKQNHHFNSRSNNNKPIKQFDISALLNANLFMPARTTNAATAPQTRLNLQLNGIFYSSNSANSFAIIRTANGKSDHYRTQQTITNGVTVDKIFPKKVILRSNGKYETLYLLGTKPPVKSEKLAINPNDLMKLVQVSPAYKQGHFIGFRIKPKKDPNLLSQFNLKSGDILTKVNDIKLDSPLKGYNIIQQLKAAKQIELQVLRGGRNVAISVTVDKYKPFTKR